MEKIKNLFKYDFNCSQCAVSCQTVSHLWQHVLGQRHKKQVACSSPNTVRHLHSLQYFFDTQIKDYPILGLEYILESQEDFYNKYTCQLCVETCDNISAVDHITGMIHLKNYVIKHHYKEIRGKDMMEETKNYLIAWHEAARRVHSVHGRKKIQVIKERNEGPTPAKVRKSSRKKKNLTRKTMDPLPDPGSQISSSSDKPPLSLQQKLELVRTDMMESVKFLQINGNADLLEFMRNFEIQNDEDAAILKELTQNCTAALMRFQEERLKAELMQGSPAGSDPASTDTDWACRESESCDPQSTQQ